MTYAIRIGLTLCTWCCLALPLHAQIEQTLTVDEAVREALEHNLALAAARHGIDVARAEVLSARVRPNPELSLESEMLSTRVARTGDTEYAMGTHFTIEGPLRRGLRIDIAELSLSVAELEFLDHVRALVLDVQEASVELLLAKVDLELARDNVSAFEGVMNINQLRYDAGDIDGGELARSRLALRQARNDVRVQEMELAAAHEHLRLLLGRNGADASVDVADDFRRQDDLPAVEQVLERAREQRPDLRALEREEAIARTDLRLQEAQRRPEFTVGTELRRLRNDGNYLGLFFSIPLPLFDRNQGEVHRARAEQLQAQAALRALRAEIEHEIQVAYTELVLARELARSIDLDMLADARHARDVTELAYRRGAASLLEVLDANMAFNETVQAYNEARADEARALYRLDFLSGDLELR